MPHADAIMPVLKASMPEPGVYSFPPFDLHAMDSMDEAQQNAMLASWDEQTKAGPFGYVAITSAVVAAIVKPGKHTHTHAGAEPFTIGGHQCQEC